MQNLEQKRKSEKSEKPRFYGQNKFFFSTLPFNPWAILATWLHVGAPHKIPAFNKTSPRAHTELELDVLGVRGKLVKYVVRSSKRKN
jgi:hypothetical protein